MNDLISRLSEIRSIYNCFDEYEEPYYRALSEAIQLVSAQPERKRGKWLPDYDYAEYDFDGSTPLLEPIKFQDGWQCSLCGQYMPSEENFCPNCGAKMESEGE